MQRRFMIIARSGHGAYIPCMPAILLARRLAKGEVSQRGASPCLDLIDLDTYIAALGGLPRARRDGVGVSQKSMFVTVAEIRET